MSTINGEAELQSTVDLETVPESESKSEPELESEQKKQEEAEIELDPEEKPEAEPDLELQQPEPAPGEEPESKSQSVLLSEVELKPETVVTDADRKSEEPQLTETTAIQSNGAQNSPSAEEISQGSRTFTMRELLSELKDGEGDESGQEPSPHSQQSTPHAEQNNAAMDLIGSVTGLDDESRSRQRILTFAAKRYASAIDRNPEDYDALYNWALVLQESADNVSSDSTSPSKDALLKEACKKYDEATRLCPTLHDAYYNWAIAISDRAKMRGRTKEAEELWKQSAANYEKAVQLNWNSPQALNNWGLALQELSAIVQIREKPTIVRTAISKFRSAIMLQYDFHRAIYNLGTVLYGLAEDTAKELVNAKDDSHSPSTELYSQSAVYIAAAHALRPNYSVYSSALRLVRSMLPLPFLKVGYLTAPPVGTIVAPHKDWKRTQFVLGHEGLDQVIKVEQKQATQSLSWKPVDVASSAKKGIRVDIADIVSVSTCVDLTLPPGAGLCINTIHDPVYLVADTWESLDGWLDAIRLVYTIHARGKGDVLAGILTS